MADLDFTIDLTDLANGLQVVAIQMPRIATSIGFDFAAGSLHEQPDETGIAHLLEHVVFRGTRDYVTPQDLNRSIEVLGAELDGTTGPDGVTIYTTVRGDRAQTALDLIAQVTTHPLLREADLEHERQIVLQEIAESRDEPESQADSLINQAVFGTHRLGTDVTGLSEDVERIDQRSLTDFHQRQWTSHGGLVVIAGDLGHLDRPLLMGQLNEIGTAGTPVSKTPVTYRTGELMTRTTDGDVAHLRLNYAIAGAPFTSQRNRAVASVLTQLLGGTMTSRLINELREVHPLCYWVDAGIWGYEAATFLSIGCSVAPEKVPETLERTSAIIDSLREQGPQAAEVDHFRAHLTGSMALGIDSSHNVMWNALRAIREYSDWDVDPRSLLSTVESVTTSDVREMAAGISTAPSIAYVGPTPESIH